MFGELEFTTGGKRTRQAVDGKFTPSQTSRDGYVQSAKGGSELETEI